MDQSQHHQHDVAEHAGGHDKPAGHAVQRTIARGEDPVCAMAVDPAQAASAGLSLTHEDVEYTFCSRGCLLEFRDDPAWFLDPAYIPAVM